MARRTPRQGIYGRYGQAETDSALAGLCYEARADSDPHCGNCPGCVIAEHKAKAEGK